MSICVCKPFFDRINIAFQELETKGIRTQANACCNTCANYDLWNQIKELNFNHEKKYWGIAYWVGQEIEAFLNNWDLSL